MQPTDEAANTPTQPTLTDVLSSSSALQRRFWDRLSNQEERKINLPWRTLLCTFAEVMMDGASQTTDENPSNASIGTVTSARGVSESNAGLAGAADHEGQDAPPVFTVADLPGLRTHSGRDVDPEDVKEVISLLGQAGAPACVAGVYALRYFGAGRISNVSLMPLLYQSKLY